MKLKKRKKGPLSKMGWKQINFHPKTGQPLDNCVMSPRGLCL